MSSPSDAFVKIILAEVYEGTKTQNIITKFRDVVRKSFNQYVNELMNDKIKLALETETNNEVKQPEDIIETTEVVSKIITTEEELEGYFIIKSMLREIIPITRVGYKDTESYFGVLLDNNTRKWVCRLQLDGSQKYLIIPDSNSDALKKKSIKYPISNVDDIYSYKDILIAITNTLSA